MTQKPVNPLLPVTNAGGVLPTILTLPLLGERPCLNFVNSVDWRFNPAKRRDTLSSYSDLLAFTLRLNLISIEIYCELFQRSTTEVSAAEYVLSDARAFRDALTSVIDDIANRASLPQRAGPRPEALAILDAARRKAHESDTYVWRNDRLSLAARPEEEGLALPWLLLARDAEELLSSSLASRIRLCAGEGCGWAFLDLSKNGKRRWCSMKLCGNREKAARFKAKNR
jgi:predicted RNA-binding Zn ribbon-like protein